jgi:hypothetical protein
MEPAFESEDSVTFDPLFNTIVVDADVLESGVRYTLNVTVTDMVQLEAQAGLLCPDCMTTK